jgi:hypothetical protein
MSSTAVLPASLRDKLDAAAYRIRVFRAVRGLSLLALALLLLAAMALAADAWLDLAANVRRALFFIWVGAGTSIAIFTLIVPLLRGIDPESLAAVVEERWSDLGERLTSSVELSGEAGRAHGSASLISLLIQETATRTGPLDFRGAIRARRTTLLAVGAIAVLLAAIIVALVMPNELARLSERFLFAGGSRESVIPYSIIVTPGDAVAARGRPIAITARIERLNDRAVLPGSAVLVLTDTDGSTTRLPMEAPAKSADFVLRLENPTQDLRYSVESGAAVSAEYHLTVVEPINVAADGVQVTITPPAYARKTFQTETLTGFHDVTALQHSRVRVEVKFTQAAREASILWPGDKKAAETAAAAQSLSLAADRLSGSVELSALTEDAYRLLLKGENGFDTELTGGELIVHVDQPPAVVKFASNVGKALTGDKQRNVLPYDSIPLELSLTDDVGIASAHVEYRVNDKPSRDEPINLEGPGRTQAAARHVFQLGGKVKEGDTIRYRLRITDNCDVPEAGLKPHVVYHPTDRWLELHVVGQAQSLAQQEIQSQRDEIDKRLDKIKKELEREQRGVYKVRQETRTQPSLLPEQVQQLKSLRQENESSREALEQLAKEMAEAAEIQDIAEKAKEVADEELRRSETDLSDAAKEENSSKRRQQISDADKQLATALSKLEALRRANEQRARERMDQAKLEDAAKHQEDLARRAEDLAAKDPVKDATAKPQADQLQREQQKVADEVQQAANQSDPLRKALEAARQEQSKQMGDRARDLAKEERDLAKNNRNPKLDELVQKQRELADKADKMAKETQATAQAAQTQPLKPDDARKAAESLQKGDAAEAVKQQDQAANELQRLARDLDRAAEQARDPKEAARQLARLQKDLQQRLGEETKKNNGKTPPAAKLQHMEREEKAIAEAVEKLSMPPREDLQNDRKEAGEQARKAAESINQGDPLKANERMEQARQAMKRLAEKMPTLPQRQQDAAREAEQLRQKQAEVTQQSEAAAKQAGKGDPQAEKQRGDATRKEQEITDRLRKMDAPNQEAQRDRARRAANKAQSDLRHGEQKDIAASQQKAKDELQKLRDAISDKPDNAGRQGDRPGSGEPPSGSQGNGAQQAGAPHSSPQGMPSKEQARQARDLERQQRELRDAVQKLTDEATRADQSPQQKLQEQTRQLANDINQALPQMNGNPQMQQAMRRAADALQQAQNSMQQAQNQARQGNQGQSQQSQQQAARSLDRAGQELTQSGNPSSSPNQQAGRDLKQAQDQMSQAQGKLAHGQAQSAQRSMQQAAQSLQKAARQMAQKPGTPKRDGQPNTVGAAPGGKPEEEGAALDPKKYAGKRWGDLPGSLQTKIVQDLKAKYGDDYSRIIKLYFEEIADTKK